MHRSVAILAFGVSLLGLAACTGGSGNLSGSNLVPQQKHNAMDQGVPLLSHSQALKQTGRTLMDQGVPLL
jgi:hypothetical protein